MAERTHNTTKFAGELSNMMDLEQLEAARSVADTMDSPGWAIIARMLNNYRDGILQRLVTHTPVMDAAEYAAKLAEVRGLDAMLDAAHTVLHVAERAALRLNKTEVA